MSLLIGALQGKSSRLTAYGDIHIKWFSDAGSTPAVSTIKKDGFFVLLSKKKQNLTRKSNPSR